jgi:nicotinamidase-related amidase
VRLLTKINRPFENLTKSGRTSTLEGIDPLKTALVVIDMQNWDAHPDFGLAAMCQREGVECEGYWDRVEQLVVPNHVRLLEAFRSAGAKVVFTVPGSYFPDFADANPNCREMWRQADAVVGDVACEIRPELKPERGEAVIVKGSSGAWSSSGIDHLLRNAGVAKLFFTGVVSNGCVMLSALGAWDHGYDVHVVEDATASFTQVHHEVALEVFSMYNFGLWATADVVKAVETST